MQSNQLTPSRVRAEFDALVTEVKHQVSQDQTDDFGHVHEQRICETLELVIETLLSNPQAKDDLYSQVSCRALAALLIRIQQHGIF